MESFAALCVALTVLFSMQRRRRLAFLFFFVSLFVTGLALRFHATDALNLNF